MSLETTTAVPQIKRIRKPAASKPRTEAQQKAYEKMVAKRKELIEQRKKLKEESSNHSTPNDIPPESSDDDSNVEEQSQYSDEEPEEPEEANASFQKESSKERLGHLSKRKAKQAILKLLLESESESESDQEYEETKPTLAIPIPRGRPQASVFADESFDEDYYPPSPQPVIRQPPQTRREHNLRNRMSRIQQQQLYRHQHINQEPSVTIFQ